MSVRCEICGTAVRPKHVAGQVEIDGKTTYFCCEACRRTFHEHPDLFPLARLVTVGGQRAPALQPS